MDPIPVLSQIKSLVQVTCGQREKARQTQINFSRQCPVISQARSAVEAIKGDQAAARETQKEFVRFVGGVVNSVPVVGHISGGIHYAFGDKAGGDQAMKAASHTTIVMAGGIGGFFVLGPLGSVIFGIGAGAAIDSAITVIDSAVHWEKDRKVRTYGIAEPFSDPKNVGKWFDAICGVALDGVTGLGAGKLMQQIRMRAVRGSPVKVVKDIETVGTIRPPAPSMTVFMNVSRGVLYIMKEKALQIGPGYVLEKIGEDVSKIVRLAGHEINIWIKNKIVHVKDARGNNQVLQEGNVYTVTRFTGKVEEINSTMMQDYIKCISLISHGQIDDREENNSDLISTKLAIQGSSNTRYVEEAGDEIEDGRYIEETEDESSDVSSVEDTEEDCSDGISVEDTEDERWYTGSDDETDGESSDGSSVEETEEECSDGSSVEDTEEECSDVSSVEDTEEECSDVSSVEDTEEECTDGSSVEDNESECSDGSSVEETEDESSDGSSVEDTEDESRDGSSVEETEDESRDGSSVEDTEDESSDVSSVNEPVEESSDESYIEENEDVSKTVWRKEGTSEPKPCEKQENQEIKMKFVVTR